MEYLIFNEGSIRKNGMRFIYFFFFKNLSRKRQQQEQTQKSEFYFRYEFSGKKVITA